jgi:alanine dehydrogenase
MDFTIVKDNHVNESRVGLNPSGVSSLTHLGHRVFIESGAGNDCGHPDEDFVKAGGQIVYSTDEAFKRGEVLLKVSPLTSTEVDLLVNKQNVFSFHHMAVTKKESLEKLLNKEITTIGYEVIKKIGSDRPPILSPMSQIAGRLGIHIAAQFLQNQYGGKGILLGGIPGVPPATIIILGSGIVGRNATMSFISLGCQVIVLDINVDRLRKIEAITNKRVITATATPHNISKMVQFADVLIGCIYIHGAKSPLLVSKDMVKTMKPQSLIIDFSIDQGGCIETSRPTTITDPVIDIHNVIHYCVPNVLSMVSRTATSALTNALLPYLIEIGDIGIEGLIQKDSGFAQGIYTHKGYCTKKIIGDLFDLQFKSIV